MGVSSVVSRQGMRTTRYFGRSVGKWKAARWSSTSGLQQLLVLEWRASAPTLHLVERYSRPT
jgi:hypothetical protein